MNIQTVLDNLDQTIAGKEKYLAECNNVELTETTDRIHRATIVGMLELNIAELKRIRADVALCPQAASAGSSCA